MNLRFIDTHAHLSFADYGQEEIPAVIKRAQTAGLRYIVNIGAGNGVEGNERAREIAEMFPDFLRFTVGVHPHDAASVGEDHFCALESLCAHPQVVAVGEVGLDYYYEHSPRDSQQVVLRRFVSLAQGRNLPLVIHDRGSEWDCANLIKDEGQGKAKGVVHCFTGSLELAKDYLDMGFLLSFTGIVTFKKAESVREVLRYAPLDRIMIETDSPFLAPVPYRGKRNEPAYVVEVAKAIADIKATRLETVAAQTTQNAIRFFGLERT